ncbi:MAG: DUF4080 domain-containing protein [Fusobacteriaceae bacterium]
MDRYLLVAINSQYVHTNLAIRYLKKYGEEYSDKNISIYETNINSQLMNTLKNIFELNPSVIFFSTYIWNREYIFKLVKELKKILPKVKIGLGGPEVTYDSENILKYNPDIDFVVKGEGERSFVKILSSSINTLSGIFEYPMPYDLDEIPFPYSIEELLSEKKILYYESMRGCPFSCSYCLSSIEKSIKIFSMERVKKDLLIFLQSNVKLVKFVDRTFNLKKERFLNIWKFLIDNYRDGIYFHFEINANLLDEECLNLLMAVPKNYFQFEIGVQSINSKTMQSINRLNIIDKLAENIKKISKNIHVHLDLIAGLPYDTYEEFKKSFDYVYNLKPNLFQLGFLKFLKGTEIYNNIEKYCYIFTEIPPYEVLSNKFINYSELSMLKEIEKILDLYYNSNKFKNSLDIIMQTENYKVSSFYFFEEFSKYFRERGFFEISHKEENLFQYIFDFIKFKNLSSQIFLENLKLDFFSLDKPERYKNINKNWITQN